MKSKLYSLNLWVVMVDYCWKALEMPKRETESGWRDFGFIYYELTVATPSTGERKGSGFRRIQFRF